MIISDNLIFNIDCLKGLSNLSDNSIDMVLTSPPYDNLRNYQDNISEVWGERIWKKVLKELFRVVKDGSVVVWVVGDATINGTETGTSFKQALYAKEIGFNLHDTMIYQKETPMPQFKSHRYTNCFEYMFVFSKGKPKRGVILEEPTKCEGRIDLNYRGQVDKNDKYVGKSRKVIKKTKIKNNIWIFSQNNDIDRSVKEHKAQFPEMLAQNHILSWSNENDLILDPFMGVGTTAKMCLLNNRRFIGFELNKQYYELANNRIKPYKNKICQ